MHVRIVDLDGSLVGHHGLRRRYRPAVVRAQTWGPSIRLACSFRRFGRFEKALSQLLGDDRDTGRHLTFYGSGDFHHVSLALLRRLRGRFNLLVIDNHPDWMRGLPFLHCGTWVYHAARLPLLQRVFHVGGDVDFDNGYRWLGPWHLLRTGKITVFPAVRRFRRGRWSRIAHEPLRAEPDAPVARGRLQALLGPHRSELARLPLYVSLDKDVLVEDDAAVNWDSGHLRLAEVQTVLEAFGDAAGDNLAGMDIVGDWSRVKLRGFLRRLLHWTEHPSLLVDAVSAANRNENTNLALLAGVVRRW